MGENKQTGPKSAAEHTAARRAAKTRRSPKHSRNVPAAALPTKPVFAPGREADLRKVFHHAKSNIEAWAAEIITPGGMEGPRLSEDIVKLCLGYVKLYIGFTKEPPMGAVSQAVLKKVREMFFEASVATGVMDMPGQNQDWYEELLIKAEKAAALRKLSIKRFTPKLPPARLQLLERAFADGEAELRAWAGELISANDTTTKRPRLSESTTEKALMELRYYLGLRTQKPDWQLTGSTVTKLHLLFRELCKRHQVVGTHGQNQRWYHGLVRAELGYANAH